MVKIYPFLFFIFLSHKVDPRLKSILFPSMAPPGSGLIDLFVLTDGMELDVKGKRISKRFPVFHLRATKGEIESFAGDEHVRFIYLPRFLSPQLDVSSKSSGFTELFEKYPEELEFKGKGVMVGVIDTGIDLFHPDFLYKDGSTKIAFLWDQTIDGNHPSGFDYGNECSADEINRKVCEVSDPSSHGTHVAGIIISEDGIYKGLAKDCVFVFVKTDYNEARVIDGIKYIFGLAEKYGLPAVVNLSLGGHVGPHDGTSILEETITSMTGNGRLVVASAGNDGNREIHIGYNVSVTSGVVLDIPSFFGLGGSAILEVWYGRDDEIEFLIGVLDKSYGEVITSTGWIPPGIELKANLQKDNVHYGDVFVDTTVTDYPFSGKKYVYIEFSNSKGTNPFVIIQRPSQNDRDGGFIHGWMNSVTGRFERTNEVRDVLISGKTEKVSFKSGDSLYTVMVPSTAKNVLSVGSYVSRVSWEYDDGEVYEESLTVGIRSSFSGIGPAINPLNGIKPLITAPGQWVISSMPRGMGAPSYMISPDGLHYALDGTSVSAPHLTAGIAILLQKNPNLGPEEIEGIICNSAKRDEFTGEGINEMWGCGKFDISSAYERVQKVERKKNPPEFVSARRDGEGIVIKTKGLSRVELRYNSKIWTDMSYAERHYIKDGGEISGKIYLLLESPDGGINEVEAEIIENGCGCSEGGNGGFLPFLMIYLLFFIKKGGKRWKSLQNGLKV
jgi:subtilisin family serine protease